MQITYTLTAADMRHYLLHVQKKGAHFDPRLAHIVMSVVCAGLVLGAWAGRPRESTRSRRSPGDCRWRHQRPALGVVPVGEVSQES